MPGSIKVSGTQRTVAAPYVKVSGTWRPAAVAYVKVAGTWRQWYAASIIDDFNRANSTVLGTVSNGVTTWSEIAGDWEILSNKAHTNSSPFALATVQNPLLSSDYTVTADVSVPAPGTWGGVALWAQDADNWYAAGYNVGTSVAYSCPSGGSLSGTTCTQSYSYNATQTVTNNGLLYTQTMPAVWTTTYSSWGCTCTGTQCQTQCAADGGTCSGNRCYVPYSYWSCPSGWVPDDYGTCYEYVQRCTTGGSDPCSTSTTYSCNPGDSPSGSTCYSSYSYSATATTTYYNNLNVYRNLNGVLSVVHSYTASSSSGSNSSPILSLKAVTSNSTITITGYTGAGQTGTAYTTSHTLTAPITSANAGIVGSGDITVDNFGLK